MSALRRQVLQLDFGGFLHVGDKPDTPPAALPRPIAEALAEVGARGRIVEVDALGETLRLKSATRAGRGRAARPRHEHPELS